MAIGIRRKGIYMATVAVIVGILAGFAVASLSFSAISQSNQNGFSANLKATTWSSTSSTVSLSATVDASGTCANTGVVFSSSPSTATDTLAAPGATCAAGDFAEELSFTLTTCPTSGSQDYFVVLTSWTTSTPSATGSGAASTVSVFTPSGSPCAYTLNLIIDYGTNTPGSAGLSVSELDATVTGN